MNEARFAAVTARYPRLRIAIVGDFCLDRYLEIDPGRSESSIETGLAVYNVTRVRSQPGAAGTILNNLLALGIGSVCPVGFCGDDGEGFELRRALAQTPAVSLEHFITSPLRHTFTYCKPLLMEAGGGRELNRIDTKNWTRTPAALDDQLAAAVERVAGEVDAMILMDQVSLDGTGVVTAAVRGAARRAVERRKELVVLADSRRGLADFPPLGFKMNEAELGLFAGIIPPLAVDIAREAAAGLAGRNGQPVFVTLAERGIVGASPAGPTEHVAAHPVSGPIDIVGAGDSVTANLAAALAAGAALGEAMELAMAAASIVIHQLGTTGTATVPGIAARLATR